LNLYHKIPRNLSFSMWWIAKIWLNLIQRKVAYPRLTGKWHAPLASSLLYSRVPPNRETRIRRCVVVQIQSDILQIQWKVVSPTPLAFSLTSAFDFLTLQWHSPLAFSAFFKKAVEQRARIQYLIAQTLMHAHARYCFLSDRSRARGVQTALFTKESCPFYRTYKRDAILQKRPIILSILLTVATPYLQPSSLYIYKGNIIASYSYEEILSALVAQAISKIASSCRNAHVHARNGYL